MRPIHISLNTAHSGCKPSSFLSSFTRSIWVFLPLPAHLTPATTTFLQADTQSSPLSRSTCNSIATIFGPPQTNCLGPWPRGYGDCQVFISTPILTYQTGGPLQHFGPPQSRGLWGPRYATVHMPKPPHSIYHASPPQPRSEHPKDCVRPHFVSYPSETPHIHLLKSTFFVDEFQNLEFFVPSPSELIITGDFNIHTDSNLTTPNKFSCILDNFHLKQHIHFPTHDDGHTRSFKCAVVV